MCFIFDKTSNNGQKCPDRRHGNLSKYTDSKTQASQK